MQQVITIHPNGLMSGLQVKPGKGVDLTKFGPASVVRASEIVWDEAAQAWKIDVLQEVGKGVVTWRRFTDAFRLPLRSSWEMLDRLAPGVWRVDGSTEAPLFFATYDDAVQVEIAYLDALRLAGRL